MVLFSCSVLRRLDFEFFETSALGKGPLHHGAGCGTPPVACLAFEDQHLASLGFFRSTRKRANADTLERKGGTVDVLNGAINSFHWLISLGEREKRPQKTILVLTLRDPLAGDFRLYGGEARFGSSGSMGLRAS